MVDVFDGKKNRGVACSLFMGDFELSLKLRPPDAFVEAGWTLVGDFFD